MKSKWKGHALVTLQLLGIGTTLMGYVGSESPNRIFLLISAAGFLLGLLTVYHNRPGNFSVHPAPLTHSSLITSGPYRYVRHPMYVSVILVLVGLALSAGTLWSWVGCGVGTVAVIGKTYLEETYLVEKHAEYKTYQHKVMRLIPFIW